MPDSTCLYHRLKNKQLILNTFSGKDIEKEVFAHLRGVWLLLPYDEPQPCSWKSTTLAK